MGRAKILIIDKDILARRAIVDILRENANYKVAGVGRKVKNTLKEVSIADPDVLLLNIEGDNSVWQSVFKNLSKQFPALPVIVLSSKTPSGAKQVIKALRMGAADFITKPKGNRNLLFARSHLKKRLIQIMKAVLSTRAAKNVSSDNREPHKMAQTLSKQIALETESPHKKLFDLMVIGGCTGGPNTLFKLISGLPADFRLPMIVAQHAPKHYTAELAQRLNDSTSLTVQEAFSGAELKAGNIWIIPGGSHSEIHRRRNNAVLHLHKGPRENGHRPSIDVLFRSASKIFNHKVLAAALSSSEDGQEGIKIIRANGGKIITPHTPHPALQSRYSMPLLNRRGMAHPLV